MAFAGTAADASVLALLDVLASPDVEDIGTQMQIEAAVAQQWQVPRQGRSVTSRAHQQMYAIRVLLYAAVMAAFNVFPCTARACGINVSQLCFV
jgi:hypothetical protein